MKDRIEQIKSAARWTMGGLMAASAGIAAAIGGVIGLATAGVDVVVMVWTLTLIIGGIVFAAIGWIAYAAGQESIRELERRSIQ